MILKKQKPRRFSRPACAGRPRYIAYVAATLDGKISLTEKTQPNWTSKEDWKFFQGELSRADAVVVGRNTFESVASKLRKRNTFVLSSRVKKIQKKGMVTFLNPARVNIGKLLAGYKKVAVVGGGAVYRTMLELGLLDELYVTIEPLLFGRGKEMFAGKMKTKRLKLISMRTLNKVGTLLLHYRV